ncbi:uncharacterized protein BDZ99DRAFT_456993 [Mytilinidion resinicola]|uniref:Uncharacterized protein n=1 Tax=Mytilinidion resinicola TaxID=574789 RepID=A0A6A6ZAC0_9PEZI|nr:uncharacterized protein BDZ99DRAFT_456993 [Mytilinidion resinicola]KAF2817244.1 hypothetical protein BDZ99DRAFT_456993 [Mytilinidion resinicola]
MQFTNALIALFASATFVAAAPGGGWNSKQGWGETTKGGWGETTCSTEYKTSTYLETKTVEVPYVYTTNIVKSSDVPCVETSTGEYTKTWVETYYKTKTTEVPYTSLYTTDKVEYKTYPEVYTTQKQEASVCTETKTYPVTQCATPSAKGGW